LHQNNGYLSDAFEKSLIPAVQKLVEQLISEEPTTGVPALINAYNDTNHNRGGSSNKGTAPEFFSIDSCSSSDEDQVFDMSNAPSPLVVSSPGTLFDTEDTEQAVLESATPRAAPVLKTSRLCCSSDKVAKVQSQKGLAPTDRTATSLETPQMTAIVKPVVPERVDDLNVHSQHLQLVKGPGPRPYLHFKHRTNTAQLSSLKSLSGVERRRLHDSALHIGFSEVESSMFAQALESFLGPLEDPKEFQGFNDRIIHLLSGRESDFSYIKKALRRTHMYRELRRYRSSGAIFGFLRDGLSGNLAGSNRVIKAKLCKPAPATPLHSLNSLLRHREGFGTRSRAGARSIYSQMCSSLADTFRLHDTWANCSGDVCSISWSTDGESFVCGAIAHSDSHNQQYNKPGNLLFGSINHSLVRALPDHRIIRPVVTKGDNSLPSMRETQDPWLYTSVVFTTCKGDFIYTASFDKTVKVWSECGSRTSLDLRGTWQHEGKVNFVVSSPFHSRIATASHIGSKAVRIYEADMANISNSRYVTYSGNRTVDPPSIHWLYCPAAIQWGRTESTSHLLAVGYSPRGTDGDEDDIPDFKKDTGELCVFDTLNRVALPVFPRSQNVFEVAWHPSLPVLFAATSPTGDHELQVRTQILIYTSTSDGFTSTRSLDCPAMDINELTVM
jgi:hypothetical protein